MNMIKSGQWRYLWLVLGSWLAVFWLTRLALGVGHWSQVMAGASLFGWVQLVALGLAYDLAFLCYAGLPLVALLCLMPQRWWQKPGMLFGLSSVLVLSLYAMLFVAAAEWLFWDEFGVRFNFIAVDYLVYSDEVINNILESYPIYPLLAALLALAVLAGVFLKNATREAWQLPLATLKSRFFLLSGWGVLVWACAGLMDSAPLSTMAGNTYQRELAANGPYQFFAAFRSNELDYDQFYATLPVAEAASVLHRALAEPNARFTGRDPLDIRRIIDNPGAPRRMNVVLVTVESLSAKYLGRFGGPTGLTPNLDALGQQSLLFTQFYATGTRTDRGLEAVSLAVPPTPGRSIVKRLGRETGYASLGQQFSAQGYDSVFLYGGRGYFDNMSTFFSGNGYRVVDQSQVADKDISFANAWGMADEDLYRQALKVADADFERDVPFFFHVMTTSNHRPYTYPDGRIDIPSGSGRQGAVKYTDYAIGEFLREARRRPWFSNTVFVFLADHCAGSAGSEDLPVSNYHIPLLIYAPGVVAPREFDGLTSQVDLAPTLLALLNMDYSSTFFGRNVLAPDAGPGRVLIGNYQHLGLYDGHDLGILSPRRALRRHNDALGLSVEYPGQKDDPLLQAAIAYYQAASHDFKAGLLSWHRDEPAAPPYGDAVASKPAREARDVHL